MQTAGSVLTCRGAEVEANASKATVDGIINELTILKDVATALHKDTMDVELKNKLLINCISVLNLNS